MRSNSKTVWTKLHEKIKLTTRYVSLFQSRCDVAMPDHVKFFHILKKTFYDILLILNFLSPFWIHLLRLVDINLRAFLVNFLIILMLWYFLLTCYNIHIIYCLLLHWDLFRNLTAFCSLLYEETFWLFCEAWRLMSFKD